MRLKKFHETGELKIIKLKVNMNLKNNLSEKFFWIFFSILFISVIFLRVNNKFVNTNLKERWYGYNVYYNLASALNDTEFKIIYHKLLSDRMPFFTTTLSTLIKTFKLNEKKHKIFSTINKHFFRINRILHFIQVF